MGGFLLEVKMSVVSKLQIVLEATTTAFDRGLKSATHQLEGFAKKTSQLHDKMDKFSRHNKEALQGLQTAGQAAVVGLGVMAVSIKGAVTAAVDFEKSMAGVKKVVDFKSPEAFKQMEKDIIALSQVIPMSAEGLANIMAAAGQSGIAQNELMRFTETAAKMGVAFDITAEQAGQALAEMRVAFKMNQDEVEALADKINYLGNTSPNSAAKIMQITQAVGAVAELGGFAADQIAALASGIVGIDPSSVATGLKNISLELTVGDNATKSQRAAFERLGLDAADVARRMKEDAVGTLMEIATLVNEKIPEYEQSAVSAALVGREALPVFAQIVQNQEMITGKIKDVGDASKYAGSMMKEFAAMAGTSAAQMQLFDNNIQAMKIAFGTTFLPVLNQAMEAFTPILKAITEWVQKNPELVQTITAIVGGVLGVIATLGGLALAFTAVTSGIGAIVAIGGMIGGFFTTISTAVSAVGMFGAALAALGFPVTAVVAGIAALVAAGVALYMNWDTVKAKATEVWNSVKETVSNAWESVKSSTLAKWEEIKQTASTKFEEVKTQIKEKFESIKQVFLSSPLGQIFATHFSVISTVAKSVFSAVQTVVRTAFGVIKGIVTGDVTAVKNAFSRGFNELKTIAKGAVDKVWGELKSLGGKLLQAGRDAIQGLINGMGEKIGAAVAKAQELAGKVISAVKGAFDIHSPSRVMKALGGYAGEGFALGLGEKVKDAKQAAQDLANAVTSTISELHKNHFMLLNHANPLAELDYKLQFGELADLTDKQKARIKELAQANLDLAKSNEALTGFNNQMSDISRQIALLGVDSPIKQLEYDLANTDKYAGYTTEQLDKLKSKMMELEQAKALQGFNSELEKATTEMQKQEYLLKNIGDKYAGMKFDLAQKGYNDEQIGQLIGAQQRTDTITAFGNLQANLQKGTAFTMPTINSGQGLQGAGNALASGISGMENLDRQYQEQLEIIKNARQAQLDINADYDKQERDLKAAHEAAKRELTLSSAEGVASGLASATKSMFGEQSKVYRAMFAVEQGVAIARSVMAIQQAIAFASANPFPMNLGAMATVAAQTMGIVAKIKAIKNPVIGQAHDGIMSVPKSGTWNLEKGERVLPKHTAQNLDNTLNRLQGNGKAVNVIIHNHTGEKVQQTTDANGDIRVIIGQEIAKQLPQHVNNPNSEFNKSLKNNYQLQRRL